MMDSNLLPTSAYNDAFRSFFNANLPIFLFKTSIFRQFGRFLKITDPFFGFKSEKSFKSRLKQI